MYCKNCGTLNEDKANVCSQCGFNLKSGNIHKEETYVKNRFIPSFILGLIASLFGMCGGLCVSMCDSLGGSGLAPFILIFCGSIFGLVGACKCLNDVKRGTIYQLIAATMIIICAYGITGSDISTIFSMLLFLASGVSGLIYLFFKK